MRHNTLHWQRAGAHAIPRRSCGLVMCTCNIWEMVGRCMCFNAAI